MLHSKETLVEGQDLLCMCLLHYEQERTIRIL